MADLTPRQRQFVAEYLVDLNATAAAIRAGYAVAGAHVHASRMLRMPKVAAVVKAEMDARAKRASVRQDEVVNELRKIAFSDMRTFAAWGKDGVELLGSDAIPDDVTACVAEVSETITQHGGSKRIKLHDKPKALELLGKHVGMFVDKVDVTSGGKPVLFFPDPK